MGQWKYCYSATGTSADVHGGITLGDTVVPYATQV